jgi:hypothetical protein
MCCFVVSQEALYASNPSLHRCNLSQSFSLGAFCRLRSGLPVDLDEVLFLFPPNIDFHTEIPFTLVLASFATLVLLNIDLQEDAFGGTVNDSDGRYDEFML